MELTKEILKKYLPAHEVTYCDVENHNISGLEFMSAGVAVKLENGLEIFGASSALDISPIRLAAYECLERYVIQTMPRDTTHETQDFKWSISNGVAIHSSYELASHNAYYELLERNEILKSWYYNTPIKHLSHSLNFPENLQKSHKMLVADFSTIEGQYVIGVFAIPLDDKHNLVYGFGSGCDLNLAIQKANKEFVTRFGFLWGEEASNEVMSSCTPDYHQEFYLKKENLHHIEEWLFGHRFEKQYVSEFQLKGTEYVNITPASWKDDFSVLKAISKDSLPLFFGLPPRQLFDFPFRCDIPHPIV